MSRFLKRRDNLETRLRDERPRPTDDLVRRISSETSTRSHRPTRRLGLAFALSMLVVLAVALTGGIGYAASTASSGASALKHLIAKPDVAKRADKATISNSSANDQYGDQIVVCHIPNGHVPDRYTILVRRSEVEEHLEHGDYLGTCRVEVKKVEVKKEEVKKEEVKTATIKKAKVKKVAICHVSGRKARTMWVFRGAVAFHVKHGDSRGLCKVNSAKAKK